MVSGSLQRGQTGYIEGCHQDPANSRHLLSAQWEVNGSVFQYERTTYFSALLIAVSALLPCLYRLLRIGSRPKGMPPGPPTVRVFGNLLQLRSKDVHFQFRKWAEQYGDIYSVTLGNQQMVVLNSPRAVKDLIDLRSSNYSSRPEIYVGYVGQMLISDGYRLVLMPYDAGWRKARKMIHNLLNIKTAVNYIPFQELELRQMLADMAERPDRCHDHVRRYSTSLVTSIIFGWRSLAFDDSEVKQIYEVSGMLRPFFFFGHHVNIRNIGI